MLASWLVLSRPCVCPLNSHSVKRQPNMVTTSSKPSPVTSKTALWDADAIIPVGLVATTILPSILSVKEIAENVLAESSRIEALISVLIKS